MKEITIVGRLGQTPKLRDLPSGESVLNLSVAVDHRTKKGGQWTSEPMWFDVTIFGKRGASVAPYLDKGSRIAASGTLGLRSYEARDGTMKQQLEVVAKEIELLDPRGEGTSDRPSTYAPPRASRPQPSPARFADDGEDDDIPF